jgi:hypothetical protein
MVMKAALLDSWPLAVALLAVVCALGIVVRWFRAGAPRPVWALVRDEQGGVQSLAFVLTVPIFIMLMLLAVQITQLMIGMIVVHYAAYAAARSATVWVPARMESTGELENRIGYRGDPIGIEFNGEIYQITPGDSLKFEQIRRAAALACVPIAPSRDLGMGSSGDGTDVALVSAFAALSPTAASNSRVPQRLRNKWAYANQATTISMRTFHRRYGQTSEYIWDEPPLEDLNPFSLEAPYKLNEIGWRDQIRVTVNHQFALLPGPGRLLARQANESVRADTVSPTIQSRGNSVYTIQLSATATMVGEGEKSVRPYVY